MKKSTEALYTTIGNNDDDDDDQVGLVGSAHDTDEELANNNNNNNNNSNNSNNNNPSSKFDWGTSKSSKKKSSKKKSTSKVVAAVVVPPATSYSDDPHGRYRDDEYHFDAEEEIPFSPINLDDSDDNDDDDDDDIDEVYENENGKNARRRARELLRGNKNKMKQRIFDDDNGDDDDDDDDSENDEEDGMDRIDVGGGWGRHGSQLSCWSRLCRCRRHRVKPAKYAPLGGAAGKSSSTSRGPPSSNNNNTGVSPWRIVTLSIGFLLFVVGSAYLGFEAGQPAGDGTANETKGEEWFYKGEEWLEHPKEHMHWTWSPNWRWSPNGDATHPSNSDSSSTSSGINNGVQHPYTSSAELTSSQLLHLSQHVFQTCSEHSLLSSTKKAECLAVCHGHFCCFEKDVAYGSCVADPYSYCFAYASCENAIEDFQMSNVNTLKETNGNLNAGDVKLLMEACEAENVKTLDGIRDCNAFCQHHLCCFLDKDDEGSCKREHPGECQAYEACRVLVDVPEDSGVVIGGGSRIGDGGGGSSTGGSGGNSGSVAVHQKSPSDIQNAVHSVCDIEGKRLDDDSWVTACHSLCANYLCCFATAGTQSNCRDTYGEETCNAYVGCGVLHSEDNAASTVRDWAGMEGAGSSSGNTNKAVPQMPMAQGQQQIPPDVKRVESSCTQKIQQQPLLREECRLACDSRSCCFQNGPGNCYMLDTEWCDEFEMCQLLYN